MLNDWMEDQDFALKQRATEALTTAFEEISKTDAMKLLRAGFVSRLAAVCQAMESLAGVAEMVNPFWSGSRPWALAKGDGWPRRFVPVVGGCSTRRSAQATISTKRWSAMQSLDGKGW
jgi:hypothetical protein